MSGRLAVLVLTAALVAQGPGKIELKEKAPGLMSQATYNLNAAIRTALGSGKGTLVSEVVEKRGNLLIYSFGVREKGRVHHVWINAKTGEIVRPQAHALRTHKKEK